MPSDLRPLLLWLGLCLFAPVWAGDFDATTFDSAIAEMHPAAGYAPEPSSAAPTASGLPPQLVTPLPQAEVPQAEGVVNYTLTAEALQGLLQGLQANAQSYQQMDNELVHERVRNELIYIVLLCALALITTTITLYFMRDRDHDARDIVNAAGLNLIIIGTIILVLVVDTSEQLTAAIGVLGAIAGYLFRSMQDEGKGGGG